MFYEPLHHKYRPKTFADLVGQEAIATTLTNAILSEKIAPAYLFTGPRGTGKTSSARILAKSLNCLKDNKPTAHPCGVCNVCQSIAKGSALDVIEIDAASNTGVDNIREIIERAQFAPVQCRYKVYVIDECHMLSGAAFNCLLKTLEEPPHHVVFVLATTDPQRVLPTIISRCQRFDFRRIALDAMVKHLSVIASIEKINISPEAVHLVASFAQGGLRDAESLLDQLSLLSGQVSVEQVWDLVGSVSEPDLLDLLQAIAHNQPEALLDCTRKIMDRGKEPLTLLQNLASFYRDLLIAKTAPNRSDLVTITTLTWQALCEQAKFWNISTILAGQQHLAKSEVQVKNTTQPRLWLEVTLLGLLPANITQPSHQLHNTNNWANQSQSQPTSDRIAPQPALQSPVSTKAEFQAPVESEMPAIRQTEPEYAPVSAIQTEVENTSILIKQSEAESAPVDATVQAEVESIPSTPEPISVVNAAAQISTEQVWQQILANLQPMSTRELLRQMGHLIEFNGNFARIGMRSAALCDRAKAYLPNIKAAFGATFKQEVQVGLELATASQTKKTPVKESPVTSKANVPPSPPINQLVHNNGTNNTFSQVEQISQPQSDPVGTTDLVAALEINEVTNAATTTNEWDDREVAIASQRLADAFNGEVVRLNDDSAFAQPLATAILPPPTDSEFYNIDAEEDADPGF
jgi:DNA polymerase-3 subunit gamma/tau